jgi:hypothetical protein
MNFRNVNLPGYPDGIKDKGKIFKTSPLIQHHTF